MFRFYRIVALVSLISFVVPAAGCSGRNFDASYELEKGATYRAVPTLYASFDAYDSTNHIIQGGCFDGKYFYVAMFASDAVDSRVIITKFDKDFNVVKNSKPLDLDHANNIAYNSRENVLVVSHCQSNDEDRYSRYSKLDPKTLKIKESGDLEHPFFSMGYSADLDKYGSGEWAGEKIDVWDGEMKLEKTFAVDTPPTLSQGVCCNRDYIWFVRSSKNGYSCELRLYNWETGELEFQIPIDNMTVEPESINIVDGTIYIIANNESYNGGYVYTLELVKQ